MDTANVSVKITKSKFCSLTSGFRQPRLTCCTPATFTLEANPPTGISQIGGKLIVQAKMKINFNLPPGGGFKAVAVVLNGKSGSSDPHGHDNFPRLDRKIHSNGLRAQIKDLWKDHGTPGKWVWSYAIIVQDSSGNIGILDPDLENQD